MDVITITINKRIIKNTASDDVAKINNHKSSLKVFTFQKQSDQLITDRN